MRLELATLLGSRLLDIYSVYNVAFALTEFKSREFRQAVEEVEAIAHKLILRLPDAVPVVLTTALAGDSDWAKAEWERIVRLGEARPRLLVVHVRCDLDETFGEFNHCNEMESGSHATRKWPATINRTAKRSLVRGSTSPRAGHDVTNCGGGGQRYRRLGGIRMDPGMRSSRTGSVGRNTSHNEATSVESPLLHFPIAVRPRVSGNLQTNPHLIAE